MPKTARSAPSTLRSSHSILVAGEVGVDGQAGPLAHQRLVPGRAQLLAARRRCGGPARPARGGSARRSSGSQATTVSRWLVIPIAVQLGALDRRRRRSPRAATRRVTSQISVGVVLDPARPREVLLELRVGAPGDPPLARRRRGRWCRSSPGRSRGSRRRELFAGRCRCGSRSRRVYGRRRRSSRRGRRERRRSANPGGAPQAALR